MYRNLKTGIISIMMNLAVLTPVLTYAQPAGGCLTPERLEIFIQNQMDQLHISGLSASVIIGEETVWKGNFGLANHEQQTPVSDSTVFLLYSVTKPVTGMALMQLAEAGLLDLDAPVNNYLPFDVIHPDFPEIPVTTRMLMSHVSGISDNWTVINSLMTYGIDTPIPLDTFLMGYLVDGGTWYNANASFSSYAPGTHFSYSNVGASLAGYLVEAITGESFSGYCDEHLFLPLGMEGSSFFLASLDTLQLAMPYAYTGNAYLPTGHISNPTIPAGFLRTSRESLDHLLCCLINEGTYAGESVLEKTFFSQMITPQYPAIEPSTGLLMGYDAGNGVWGHSGGYNGVKTAMFFHPTEGWGINVLSNGSGEPWQIIFLLEQFAREYQPLTATELFCTGSNASGLIGPGETVSLSGSFRSNAPSPLHDLTITLSSPDEAILITSAECQISLINPGETVSFAETPFIFTVSSTITPHQVWLFMDIWQAGTYLGRDSAELYLGQAHVILADDEGSLYKGMTHPETYYREALDKIPVGVNYLDLSRWKLPSVEYLGSSDAVIWFTGLTGGNVLTTAEQDLLSAYLNQGGNLFLTGQFIAADTVAAGFLFNRLHAGDGGVWNGQKTVEGDSDAVVGSGMIFSLEGGTGSGTQVGVHRLTPGEDGFSVFHYATDPSAVAMVGSEGNGKTLFAGFGFEGISAESDRDTLMQRIIRWFGPMTGIGDQEWGEDAGGHGSVLILPNPVFHEAKIRFTLEASQEVMVSIYSASGEKVVSWNTGILPPGMNQEKVDTSSLHPGVYLCVVKTEKRIMTAKLIRVLSAADY